MSAVRFHSRLALLDLELRRLWREPWLAYASVMLVPLFLTMLAGSFGYDAAPGVQIFRALSWWWCLAAHVVFIPLMGLAFRGEEKRDENEALQVAGFSSFAIFSGVLGPRLVTALAVLLIPAPLLALCYLLGGLTGSGLLAACLHLPAHFLLVAALYALLGVLVRRDGMYWALCLPLALVLVTTGLADGTVFSGSGRAIALATQSGGAAGWGALGLATGLAVLLLLLAWLVLLLRLRGGRLAADPPARRSRWAKPGARPTPDEAVRWKERWFGLGGIPGRWIRLGWGPLSVLLLLVLPHLAAPGKQARSFALFLEYLLIFGLGLVLSLFHGIQSAYRLFAREHQDQTLDDLLLARGEAFGIVHEKLQEYRSSTLDIWISCLAGLYLGFLFVIATDSGIELESFVFFLLFVLPAGGFMLFRLQECFTTSLFQAWSREEASSGLVLVKEALLFVASILGYMFVIPFSLMITFFTFVFALVLIPLFVYYWIRYFNRQLREKQRDLVRNFCRQCGDSIHHPDLERLYPGPVIAAKRRSFVHPATPANPPPLPPRPPPRE